MRRGAFLLLALLVAPAEPANAQEDWRTICPSLYEANFPTCIFNFSGAESPERIRADGKKLIRVLLYKGVRVEPLILIVEAILPNTGNGQLVLRDPKRRNISRTFSLERSDFDALEARMSTLRFEGAALHGGRSTPEPTPDRTVCIDPASAFVEVVRVEGVASADMGYCSNEDVTFVESFLKLAASAEAKCMEASQGWSADALHDCLYKAQP